MGSSGQPSHRESSTADRPSPAETQRTGSRTGQNEKQPFLVVRKRNWEVTVWALWLVWLLTRPANIVLVLFKSALRSFCERRCSNSKESFRL